MATNTRPIRQALIAEHLIACSVKNVMDSSELGQIL
jgi:hypothetical protein